MLGKTSLGLAALTLAVSIGAAALAQQPATPPTPPAGPGFTLITERCGFCHNTGQVFGARKPAPDWAATVQSMIDRGAELDPDEQKTVVAYLAANFAAPATAGSATAAAPTAPSPAPATPAHP